MLAGAALIDSPLSVLHWPPTSSYLPSTECVVLQQQLESLVDQAWTEYICCRHHTTDASCDVDTIQSSVSWVIQYLKYQLSQVR